MVCIGVLFLFISVLEVYNTFSKKNFQMEKICYFEMGKMCHIPTFKYVLFSLRLLHFILNDYDFFLALFL